MKTFISLFVWIFAGLTSIVFFFIALSIFLLTFLFDKKRTVLHMFSCFWANLYIIINPYWRLHIQGREKIKNGEAYVLVSNHQSLLDIHILYSLYKQYKWVSKSTVFKIPFIGWNMTLNGYISVNRSSIKSQQHMLDQAKAYLKQGSSLMMFPEGTRAKDGVLGRFKEGAFRLAKESDVRIVPIVLDGSFDALPPHKIILNKSTQFKIQVLDPVEKEFIQKHSLKEITNHVHKIMSEELDRIRADH